MTINSSALSAAGYRSIQERMTTVSVEAMKPFADDLLNQERMCELNLENFHVVLVPLQLSEEERAFSASKRDTARPLMLSLTWRELILKLGTSAQFPDRSNKANIVRFGEVVINLVSMEVRRSNRPVTLTAMEFKVLKHFAANPNRVISRDDLLNQVWGYDNYPCTRTVDNHILRLRQKLEPDFGSPVYFRTVHGIGYKFTPSQGTEIE